MSQPQPGMFVTPDGRRVGFTFYPHFALGIFGGAVLPKLTGMVADHSDLSRGFIVPLICFCVVALYGFLWPRLSGHQGMHGVNTSRGH